MARKLDYMDLKQILSLQQDGLSNRMIAKTLGVGRNTVNYYMALFKACDVSTFKLSQFGGILQFLAPI